MKNEEEGILIKKGRVLIGKVLQTRFTNEKERASLETGMLKQNRKGFTLAELLVVVAIIGVLVAVSIPVFTGQLNKAREAADMANERAAKAAALVDFYGNGYDIKSGGPLAGHYYQYHYDADSGKVVLQITANSEKIRSIKPYGHKYTMTRPDPVKMFTGWTEFRSDYSAGKDSGYHKVGETIDNSEKIVTVIVYYDSNESLQVAEWWLDPATANISGNSGK